MVEGDEGEDNTPMTNNNEKNLITHSSEEKITNTVLLENVARLLKWFSIILFLGLSITCMASWSLDPIAVVIGYWLVLLSFSTGYVIKKTIRSSSFPNLNCSDKELRRLILTKIGQIKKYFGLKSKQEVREILQGWPFRFLSTCLVVLGLLMISGTILMHMYLVPNDIKWLALKLSFGIWIAIQGIAILFSFSPKLLSLTFISCIICLSINIFNDIIPSFTSLSILQNKFFLDRYYHSIFWNQEITKLASNWPENDIGKPIYPSWILALSLMLHKGSMIPLGSFLFLLIISYISCILRFGQKDSDLKIMVDKQQQSADGKNKWIFGLSGATFIAIGLCNAYSRVFLENFSLLFYDTYWFNEVYGIIGDWMCCILIVIGFLTITMASKSRSTYVLIILLPSMLGLLGICTYSSVMSVNLFTNSYEYYGARYLTSDGEQRTSLSTSWDTMMKSVMNCGATLEEDISNNGIIYLCKKESYYNCNNKYYSDNDRTCYQGCQTFSFDQDAFCNGVFDFPLIETISKRDTYNSKYYLSNCNVTEKYDKYRSRYNNAQNITQDQIKRREKQWSIIKNNIDDTKLYKSLIFFSDELNCSPYSQILEISLMVNISMSVIIGLISLINFVAMWKRAKSPDSPIRKFLMNLYHTNSKYLDVSMNHDPTA